MRPLVLFAAAASLFGQTAEERAYQTLNKGLHDANPAKRIASVIAMGVVRPESRPLALVDGMFDDKDLGVRQSACLTLGEMKATSEIPRLRAALNDKAPEVVFAAAKTLYAMNDADGRAVLIDILVGEQHDSSNFVKTSIRDAKLKLHDPRAMLLIGVNQAAGLLGPFGAGVPIAEQLLKDNQASGKTVAALLLATDKSPESEAAMRTALGDKNWTVRAAALRAIALRDVAGLYDDVAPLLDDKRDEVTYNAATALIRLKQSGPDKKPAARPKAANKK